MSIIVEAPFQNFTGLDGKPLTNGKVYIGQVGTDPTVFANQIPVFWDEALTIPASQPLTTNSGYIVRFGTPARVYVATDYSISVKNANNVLVYYLPDFGVENYPTSGDLAAASGSGLIGWMQSGIGAILRTVLVKLREIVSPADFSTTQAAVDSCINTGRILELPAGYIDTPTKINLNGSGNVGTPNQQRPGLIGMRGKGRFSTSVFLAKTALDYVVQGNNFAGIEYSGFSVDGAGLATGGIDLSWNGGSEGSPTLAPSNQNVFENITVQGCSQLGINLDQCHDSRISGIWVRGVDPEGIALSLQGSGGQLVMDNVWLSSGIFRVAAQNASLVNCGFFGGVQLTGSGFNNINWTGIHFYPRAANGVVISNDSNGNATRACFFSGCYTNDCTYFTNGLWHAGATFTACQFNDWAGFADPVNFTPAGGAGQLPLFTFINCSFGGSTPVSVAGKFRVRVLGCKSSTGVIIDDYGDFTATGSFLVTSQMQQLNQAQVFSARSEILPAGNALSLQVGRGTYILSVLNIDSVPGAGGVRTHTTFHIGVFDNDAFTVTQLATNNGSGGPKTFTVTMVTPNVVRITNTAASPSIVSASAIGVSA